MQINIQEIARKLLEAEKTQKPIPPLTSMYENINVDDAYRIQLAQLDEKLAQGARVVGKKIGLTSAAMQQMFNVSEPDYGFLLNTMMHMDGDEISLDSFIQPKIEFEIGFMLKKALKGPGVTMYDVLAATDYVIPAFEIIDSRIADWKIRFEDTVADNGSSSRAVLGGNPTPIEAVDLSHIGMVVSKNGKQIATASGAAVMGHPAKAVAWLANALGEYDISLMAGEIVLSGAFSAAVPIHAGDTFVAEFDRLGTVTVSFTEGVGSK